VVMSAQNTILTAITAAERGAFDYLPKPFDLKELTSVVRRALAEPSIKRNPPDRVPGERREIYRSMIETLARLHSVDWRAAGLTGYGKPDNYVARQVQRWTAQYRASETERIDAIRASLTPEQRARVSFATVRDYYDEPRWAGAVKAAARREFEAALRNNPSRDDANKIQDLLKQL